MAVLIASVFLYSWVAKNGLGQLYRIIAGLTVLGSTALLVVSLFCCCGGCPDAGCGYGKGGKSCSSHGAAGCGSHGEGGEGEKHHCKGHGEETDDEGEVKIEKEVTIKNGDTVTTETSH